MYPNSLLTIPDVNAHHLSVKTEDKSKFNESTSQNTSEKKMKQNVSIEWPSEANEGQSSPAMNHINFALDDDGRFKSA